MDKFQVLREGRKSHVRKYPLRNGGYWSVVMNSGSEIYYPSEEEAYHAFHKVEVEVPKDNPDHEPDHKKDGDT